MEFYNGEFYGRCLGAAYVLYKVTSCGDTDTVCFILVGVYITYQPVIHILFPLGGGRGYLFA